MLCLTPTYIPKKPKNLLSVLLYSLTAPAVRFWTKSLCRKTYSKKAIMLWIINF